MSALRSALDEYGSYPQLCISVACNCAQLMPQFSSYRLSSSLTNSDSAQAPRRGVDAARSPKLFSVRHHNWRSSIESLHMRVELLRFTLSRYSTCSAKAMWTQEDPREYLCATRSDPHALSVTFALTGTLHTAPQRGHRLIEPQGKSALCQQDHVRCSARTRDRKLKACRWREVITRRADKDAG